VEVEAPAQEMTLLLLRSSEMRRCDVGHLLVREVGRSSAE